MTDVQEFCLRWNNHQSNLVSAFHDLRLGEDFVDVTLACDGRSLQAHKVVLSACSPFFRELLKTTPCKHPVIVLKDILFGDLVALVEFMYQGEVRVGHDGLPSFLKTAEVLRVRGLTEEASRQKTSQLAFKPTTINSQTHNLNTSSSAYSSPQLCQYGSHQVQSDTAHSPANTGVNVSSHWTNTLDEVKVEEVDLDSSSEGAADGEADIDGERPKNASMVHQPSHQSQHKEMEVSPAEEDEKEHIGTSEAEEAEESAPALVPPPCLTLQSFARIPSLVAQDFNPPVAPPDFVSPEMSGPTGSEDRRLAQELQVSVEQENLVGRTPGRTSTSDRPRWPCPFCLRLLSSRSSVRRHIEDRHTNDNSRHPCPLCERLYRTRNSLQYHLSTAHRDREPGPRGRPRTRPRTPSTTESVQPTATSGDNKSNHEAEAGSRIAATNPATMTLYNLSVRGPPFGLPPT